MTLVFGFSQRHTPSPPPPRKKGREQQDREICCSSAMIGTLAVEVRSAKPFWSRSLCRSPCPAGDLDTDYGPPRCIWAWPGGVAQQGPHNRWAAPISLFRHILRMFLNTELAGHDAPGACSLLANTWGRREARPLAFQIRTVAWFRWVMRWCPQPENQRLAGWLRSTQCFQKHASTWTNHKHASCKRNHHEHKTEAPHTHTHRHTQTNQQTDRQTITSKPTTKQSSKQTNNQTNKLKQAGKPKTCLGTCHKSPRQ